MFYNIFIKIFNKKKQNSSLLLTIALIDRDKRTLVVQKKNQLIQKSAQAHCLPNIIN